MTCSQARLPSAHAADTEPGRYPIMPKRRRSDEDEAGSCVKRTRTGPKRNLLDISDEILLRILSVLPTRDLLRAERYVLQIFGGKDRLTFSQRFLSIPLPRHRSRSLESEIL